MADPWDRPPIPIHGDANIRAIYEWTGRVITVWGNVEWQLARLHSIFANDPDGPTGIRAYGEGKIFRDRLLTLQQQSSVFFVTNPNQQIEGELDSLFQACEGFADRRNDVAHGVVMPTEALFTFRDPKKSRFRRQRHALAPPYSHNRGYIDIGFPKYAYTSKELHELAVQLARLYKRISAFRNTLGYP